MILYSGNWGLAHDDATFVEGYARYRRQSTHGLTFWLNAVGAKADRVESELRTRGLPVYRSKPVPLEILPQLLLAADVHLITLRDAFVGYVLPSKIHACIESGKSDLIHRQREVGCSPPGQRRLCPRANTSGSMLVTSTEWRTSCIWWSGQQRIVRRGHKGLYESQLRAFSDSEANNETNSRRSPRRMRCQVAAGTIASCRSAASRARQVIKIRVAIAISADRQPSRKTEHSALVAAART